MALLVCKQHPRYSSTLASHVGFRGAPPLDATAWPVERILDKLKSVILQRHSESTSRFGVLTVRRG